MPIVISAARCVSPGSWRPELHHRGAKDMFSHRSVIWFALILVLIGRSAAAADAPPRQVSGIYPHLAMFNEEAECGTGAVVPWADRLWAVTYAPHKPKGSTDKLYEI